MGIIEYKVNSQPHILIFLYSIFSLTRRIVRKYPLLTFAFIGMLVYGLSLFNGFVWDDEEQLLNNTLVHSLNNIGELFSNSTFSSGGAEKLGGVYYRPVMMLFFTVLHSVFGPSGFIFHLAQVLMHIIVVWLLYKVVSAVSNKRVGFVSAVLFLVHPVVVEAVVYVSAVQDVFVGLFGLLSLWVLIARKNAALTAFFLFMAFLAKENAVVFLFIEIAYLALFKKHKEQEGGLVQPYFIYTALALGLYFLLRFGIAGVHFQKFELAPIVQLSFWQRLLNIPALFVHYLTITFWPLTLAIAQHWVIKNYTFSTVGIPFLISIGCFFLMLIGSLKIGKSFLFLAIWFVVGIGMYMQLFPFDFTVAERWYYIGLMGFIGMLVLAADHFGLLKKPVVLAGISVIVAALSLRTIVRTWDWRNELALFSHDITVSHESFDLTNNYAVALFRVGRYDEAKKYFGESIRLAPTWTINTSNMGAVYQREKNFKQAKRYYLLSMKNGDYYLAYENYASVLIAEKNYIQAQKFLEEQALLKYPYNENLRGMYQYLLKLETKK